MLMIGLDFTLGRSSSGLQFRLANSTTFSPAKTRETISMIVLPTEGPTAPLKWTSRCKRSKLTMGKHPVTISFLSFGARFIASIMRFSVGPFTAQVL